MKNRKEMVLDFDGLRSALIYDPETGLFRWRHARGRMASGSLAGNINHYGYRMIWINRYIYSAHRLAWLYTTGEWPRLGIDHINGNPSDNRFCNLRLATSSQNGHNKRAHKDSRSGVKGVDWHCGKWRAAICINRKWINLGRYENIEDAKKAYAFASARYHAEYGRC